MSIVLKPLDAAVEYLRRKTPVTSPLRTAGWDRVALGLRDRAQFSAAVESLRLISFVQERLDQVLSQARTEAGTLRDRAEFVRDMMELARSEGVSGPGVEGSIADIASESRADMIYRIQTEQAYGYAAWQSGQDADALDAAPAQELVRIEDRREKRNWRERWRGAGGKVFAGDGLDGVGRLVALKTDPVWTGISRFGTPWPPYDFGSGVGVRDVLRPEAEALGLVAPGAPPPTPVVADVNQSLEVEADGLGEDGVAELTEVFGDQVEARGGKVRWLGSRVQDYVRHALAGRAMRGIDLGRVSDLIAAADPALADVQLALESSDIRDIWAKRGSGEDEITPLEFEMVPHIWRNPDSIKGSDSHEVALAKDLAGKTVMIECSSPDERKRSRLISITVQRSRS